MQSQELDPVRQRFDFSSWSGINRLERELTVRNLTLPSGLVPGLDPRRAREISPGDGTRLVRTSWRVSDEPDALLVMDIHECESREAAHLVLLDLLANMQAPDVERLDGDAPGDIAFSHDASTALVYARGNVTVSIRNGGATVVPVGEVARTIDGWIMEQGG